MLLNIFLKYIQLRLYIYLYLKFYRFLKLSIYLKLKYLKLHIIYTVLYMYKLLYVTRGNRLYTVVINKVADLLQEPLCISKCVDPQFSLVQSLSHVQLFMTPWTTARQASLSITNSRSLLRLMPIESVTPSKHLILCRPLLLLPSIFPRIRAFSNESALHIRRPKYWSFSFSISPSNEYSGFIFFRIDYFDFLAVQGTLKSLL